MHVAFLLAALFASLVVGCARHDNHQMRQRMARATSDQDWTYEVSYDWGRVNPGKFFQSPYPSLKYKLTCRKITHCARQVHNNHQFLWTFTKSSRRSTNLISRTFTAIRLGTFTTGGTAQPSLYTEKTRMISRTSLP